ncbi:formate/nitrite transporter family protein [Sporohalobacter salinus]|uniref:formate/nitrite transporter family protein n=1 Tax=Sporohalobacter salinus TaxID=1494606 RepID=UPI00195FBE37|nr:formate/nitrite transporter family protein [Sporohalobacter salinus]MBM7622879.1 formate/nitrite transporter [Sporohalobacter salinus]
MKKKKLLSPDEITDALIEVGIKKVRRSNLQMLFLGILAGAFIALGAYASNMVIHDMNGNYGLLKFVQGAVFPVGLILVLVAGADLFTGNSLIFVSFLEGKVTLNDMLKNWILIYIGNFIGSIAFAWLVYKSGLFAASGGKLGALHVKIAAGKTSLPFIQAMIRGILANFVVCLAVWMGIGAKDMIGKVFASWFPIMAFVAGGFEHSIANMYYIPAGLFAKGEFTEVINISHQQMAQLNWIGFINNLIPVTLGNIIGGSIFVGTIYWVIFKYQANEQNIIDSSTTIKTETS